MAITRTMFRRSFKRLCICLLICTAFYVINYNLDLVQGNTQQREDATYHGEGTTDPFQNMSIRLLDEPLPVTGIVSYPGAGNTWTRYLLQKVSDGILEHNPNEENKPEICPLRHPKTEKKCLFLFCHGDRSLYEMVQFKEEFRSWFIGNSVQHDGSLYLTTTVDPVFLVLPYLIKAEQSGKFMTLDQIVMDDDYPECHRLLNTSGISELYQVTDVKGADDIKAYRYSKDKTLSWLKLKTEKVSSALEEKNIGLGTSGLSHSKSSSKEDYLRYAFGLVSDYLPLELCNSLRENLGIPAAVEKRASTGEVPPAKRAKLGDITPDDDYSKQSSLEKVKSKSEAKLTTAQKKLSQIDKTGMRSLTSFFSPKSKS